MPFQPPLDPMYTQLEEAELEERIRRARAQLGSRLVLLVHHYQRDEIMQFADFRGDSFKLSRQAAAQRDARYIVFCGVHFMAESADILSRDDQIVILPDMDAGCTMADMAPIAQVRWAWDQIRDELGDVVVPLVYINSSAAIKAFCGQHGGAVCTSSNAPAVFEWALQQAEKIFFLPDEHLGRNTAYRLGIPLEEMVVWDPREEDGGLRPGDLQRARIILWKGFCSVHQRFRPEHVDRVRALMPDVRVVVHPECAFEVVQKADAVGSTEFIIRTVCDAPPGTKWAVGTEIHLVNRLARENPDKTVVNLDLYPCLCTTMYRITPQRLAWALDRLCAGEVVNRVVVPDRIKEWARVALDRMLAIAPRPMPQPAPA